MPLTDALEMKQRIAPVATPDGCAFSNDLDTDHAFVVLIHQLLDDVSGHFGQSFASFKQRSMFVIALLLGGNS